MLTRMQHRVEVVAQPWQVFAGQQMGGGERGVPAYSATLYGFGTATGETMSHAGYCAHREQGTRRPWPRQCRGIFEHSARRLSR